jgi:hypothetical protein
MGDFDELPPASWAARQKGCTCDGGTADLRADPACKIHGVAAFKRARRGTDGKASIERFRQKVIGRRSVRNLGPEEPEHDLITEDALTTYKNPLHPESDEKSEQWHDHRRAFIGDAD